MSAGSIPAASTNLRFSPEIHAPIESLAHYTGYNFTDFSDDLTDLSYDHQGSFVNVIGTWLGTSAGVRAERGRREEVARQGQGESLGRGLPLLEDPNPVSPQAVSTESR